MLFNSGHLTLRKTLNRLSLSKERQPSWWSSSKTSNTWKGWRNSTLQHWKRKETEVILIQFSLFFLELNIKNWQKAPSTNHNGRERKNSNWYKMARLALINSQIYCTSKSKLFIGYLLKNKYLQYLIVFSFNNFKLLFSVFG